MRVAITGGIAEGKSTVLQAISELGFATASADAVAKTVFERSDVQSQIADLSGLNIPISRDLLREAISMRAELRHEVNALMHPLILDELRSSQAQFVEVPLLLEAVLQGEFDRVWVVTCGVEEQRRRLVQRYGSDASAEAILSTQLPSRAKTPFSDQILRTNNSPEAVRRLLSEAVKSLFAG